MCVLQLQKFSIISRKRLVAVKRKTVPVEFLVPRNARGPCLSQNETPQPESVKPKIFNEFQRRSSHV